MAPLFFCRSFFFFFFFQNSDGKKIEVIESDLRMETDRHTDTYIHNTNTHNCYSCLSNQATDSAEADLTALLLHVSN